MIYCPFGVEQKEQLRERQFLQGPVWLWKGQQMDKKKNP